MIEVGVQCPASHYLSGLTEKSAYIDTPLSLEHVFVLVYLFATAKSEIS